IGPIALYQVNSALYSAIPLLPNDIDNYNLFASHRHQMPLYKENLGFVLVPLFKSMRHAMRTYVRQGGTSSIFVNGDDLPPISVVDRDKRIVYYYTHGI
ncbi:hypothetical protein IW262DRAFT_1241277, partial [Armillaria fumosa]